MNDDILQAIRLAAAKAKGKKKKIKTQDGEDATIYVYTERQIAQRQKEKAERLDKLRGKIDGLRSQVKKDLGSKDSKTRITALAVALIDETFERVGNDGSADEGHYGVTGWLMDHMTLGKDKAVFKYVGKSGVDHEKVVKDPKALSVLRDICKGKKKNDPVLSDSEGEGKVSAEDVNAYLKPFEVTAKDLRGFHANREMSEQLTKVRAKGGKLPSEEKDRTKQLKEEFKTALEAVAEAVGHEPATLRSQYLVPGMESSFLQDGTVSKTFVKRKASASRIARWCFRGSQW